MTNSQNGNGMGQIIAAVLITLIAGGTAPWWWDKFFAGESSPNTSIEDPSGQNASSAPESSGDSVDQGVVPISWSDSPARLRISKSVGERFFFSCESGGTSNSLYGTGIYTGGSSICEAAVHTGKIIRAQGGGVAIEVRGQQQSFKASQRNGVLSKEYSAYGSSFVVLP